MSDKTGIEWTDATWNPVTGCTKVSPGCDHCYAIGATRRISATGNPAYQGLLGFDGIGQMDWSGLVNLLPDRLEQPLRWTRPRMIFVNSMSDLFHENVPDEFIAKVFAVMALAPQHRFQVLTKRHSRMRSLLNDPLFLTEMRDRAYLMTTGEDGAVRVPAALRAAYGHTVDVLRGTVSRPWPLPNVWLGVSVENQKWADIRLPALLETPAAVRFLSCEPLLGPVDLHREWLVPDARLCGYSGATTQDHAALATVLRAAVHQFSGDAPYVNWVIVGGESGPGARPMHPDWPRQVRDQCAAAGVPFLFKQWGNWSPRLGGPVIVNRVGATLEAGSAVLDETAWAGVENVGKKAAGRALDGRTHDGYPERVQ